MEKQGLVVLVFTRPKPYHWGCSASPRSLSMGLSASISASRCTSFIRLLAMKNALAVLIMPYQETKDLLADMSNIDADNKPICMLFISADEVSSHEHYSGRWITNE